MKFNLYANNNFAECQLRDEYDPNIADDFTGAPEASCEADSFRDAIEIFKGEHYGPRWKIQAEDEEGTCIIVTLFFEGEHDIHEGYEDIFYA